MNDVENMGEKKVRLVIIGVGNRAKLDLDCGLSGPIVGPSSYFFKTPPKQFHDDLCREKTETFIKGEYNE